MLLAKLSGLLVFVAALILTFILVPLKQIKELFSVGLVGGFGIGFILNYLMSNVFGYWSYRNADFINVLNVPILLTVGWVPCIIAFSYLIVKYKQILTRIIVLAAFPLGGIFIHYFLRKNNMLEYNNWNLPLTFSVSLAIHTGIFVYLYLRNSYKVSA